MNAYYVTKDNTPCRIVKNGLHHRGILMPCSAGEEHTIFGYDYASGKRKAVRAIKRTMKVADRMKRSVLSEWEKISGLVSNGIYSVEKKKVETTPDRK